MALTLLRHTTPEIAQGVCYGMTDLALASSFASEAQTVLDTLPGCARIVSSPLQRCLRLAETLGRARGLPVEVDPAWREMDFGSWETLPWSDIPRAELDGWAADFDGYKAHGGESVSDLRARITAALSAAPDNALIVTHMGCIKAARAIKGDRDGWNAKLSFGQWTQL